MKHRNYKYIYGPVSSWRLGRSLGIDPVSERDKVCSFNCIYCQLGETVKYETARKIFVPTDEVVREVASLPDLEIDYITFSGRGEPTLAGNLKDMIKEIRKIRKERIAVITNSSLMGLREVQDDLLDADFLMVKVDAATEERFNIVNRPCKGITLKKIIDGIKEFKSRYKGRFALQMMFVDQNRNEAPLMADIAKEIAPYEVQLNTPLRPSGARPVSKEELKKIESYFKGFNTVSVYSARKKETHPISSEDTLKRRGKI